VVKERWDAACQTLLVRAKEHAQRLGNPFFGTEHLLWAMLDDPQSLLCQLLSACGVAPARVVKKLTERVTPPAESDGGFPLTPRIRAIVAQAEQQSLRLGAPTIHEKHLLAALLEGGPGVALRVLSEVRASPQQLQELLSRNAPSVDDVAVAPDEALPRREDLLAATRADAADLPRDATERQTEPRRLELPKADANAPAPPKIEPKPRKPTLQELAAEQGIELGAPAGVRAPMPMLGNPALLDWMMHKSGGERQPSSTPTIDRLGRDLVEQARRGELGPIVGRDAEIEELVLILSRAYRNNPLLLGEAGVGKTAVVEGLAMAMAQRRVPPALSQSRLVEIPAGSLRGLGEAQLQDVVDEAIESNVILVIDQLHELGTTANLLRPVLARGDVRVIGICSLGDYGRDIEKNAAFARCFHGVPVDEPVESLGSILGAIAQRFEKFHGVSIALEALEDLPRLARENVPDRHLPDGAVDLLDEACVKAVARGAGDGGRPMVTAALVGQVAAQWGRHPNGARRVPSPGRARAGGNRPAHCRPRAATGLGQHAAVADRCGNTVRGEYAAVARYCSSGLGQHAAVAQRSG
jgi:ATP-dependent Clp protease ATP-binding subunit ClpA